MQGHTVLQPDADDRQGPAMQVDDTNEGVNGHTNAEQPDTPNTDPDANKPAKQTASWWAPDGFYWTKQYGQDVLKPHGWLIQSVIKEADFAYINAMSIHGDSAECKNLIKTGGEELLAYLQTRRAINDKAFERKLKQEADDAAYQIVQAAKYKLDAESRARSNRENGYSNSDDEKLNGLRAWSKASLREGYILAGIVFAAAKDEGHPPVLDFKGAATRVCGWSAKRLTETLAARFSAQEKQQERSEQAADADMADFYR